MHMDGTVTWVWPINFPVSIKGDGCMCIAQIVYLLAAKLISSSANQSLGVCPLLEAG